MELENIDTTRLIKEKNILFPPDFLKKLDTLNLISKRIFSGKLKGERRSQKRGQSVEFADFRNYVPGDDFRYIDWNAYARMENLFLKLFLEEEDISVYFLLDGSKSMHFGKPLTKFDYAKRIVGALSYISLSHLDRISISLFSDKEKDFLPFTHGKNQIFKVFNFLLSADIEDGFTDISKVVLDFRLKKRKKGTVIIVSDLFSFDNYKEQIKLLKYSKYEPIIIQTLSSDELSPEIGGDFNYIDSENEEKLELSLNKRAIKYYKKRLNLFLNDINKFCQSLNIPYILSDTSKDFEDLILNYFRKAQIIGQDIRKYFVRVCLKISLHY